VTALKSLSGSEREKFVANTSNTLVIIAWLQVVVYILLVGENFGAGLPSDAAAAAEKASINLKLGRGKSVAAPIYSADGPLFGAGETMTVFSEWRGSPHIGIGRENQRGTGQREFVFGSHGVPPVNGLNG